MLKKNKYNLQYKHCNQVVNLKKENKISYFVCSVHFFFFLTSKEEEEVFFYSNVVSKFKPKWTLSIFGAIF